jgi:hypothetical protein
MSANQFFNTTNNTVHKLVNMPDVAGKKVFNSGGAGVQPLVNTSPQVGFKNAGGLHAGGLHAGGFNSVGKFYGADGTSNSDSTPSATLNVSTTAPTSTTSATTTVNPTTVTPLGMNIPTLIVLGAGFLIGYFMQKSGE